MSGPSFRTGDDRQTRNVLDNHERRLSRVELSDVLMGDGRRLFLRSPNGHYWNITVSDAGALSATDMGATAP